MTENDLNQPKLDDTFAEQIGKLVQIQGRIIEVEFPETKIPDCLSTLDIIDVGKDDITKAVVIQRLEKGVVRAITMVVTTKTGTLEKLVWVTWKGLRQ